MRSELNYAGKNLSEFGMWFDNSKVYKKPAKRFMGYDIPARNGTLYQSENKFNNVIIEFDCFIKDNFDQNYNDLVNYLNSFETYQKLVNSYNGNMYRMALFHEAIEVDTGQFLKDGRFKLFFDCKPQEYYADGAEFERIASHYDTYTGDPAELVNEGESSVISLRVALNPVQNLNGYDSPWVGGAGKNMLPTGSFTISGGGTTTATFASDGIHINGTKASGMWVDYLVTKGGTLKANTSYILSLGITNASVSWSLTLRNGGTQLYEVIANNGSGTLTINPTSDVTFDRWRLTCRTDNAITINSVITPMLRLSSVTDATYEPYENICPITGHTSASVTRTGKNLLKYPYRDASGTTSFGITYTVASDGTVYANGTATENSTFYLTATMTHSEFPNTMVLNGNISRTHNSFLRVQIAESPWTVIGDDRGNGVQFSIPNDGKNYQIIIRVERGQTVNNLAFKPMVRIASVTDATYEPYQGNTYTIDLNGTRYGGTVDLVTGVLTVTHYFVTINGQYTVNKHGSTGLDGYYIYLSSNGLPKCSSTQDGTEGQFNMFKLGKLSDGNGCAFVGTDTIQFRKDGGGTGADMKTWFASNPLQVCYPLQTPQTIHLTAQQISLLTGINYISSSDEVTVITRTPLILKNPSPMTAKPIFKFTNISAPFTVSANGETIISFQNAIRLVGGGIVNNMFFNATGTNLIMQKQGTPNYEETSFLINSGWLPAGRYFLATMPIGNLEVTSMDGTHLYSSGGTFTLTDITQVKVWYVITPNASTPQNFNFPIYLRPLGTLYVDSELMDCYMLDGDTAYSFNECVSLPKDFLQLDERTVVTMTSGAVGFIAPNWWRL